MPNAPGDRLTAAEWRQLHGLPPAGADLAKPGIAEKRNSSSPAPPSAHLRPKRGEMNKTEAAYALHLNALQLGKRIKSWKFDSITLRLADDTTYRPDFFVEMPSGPHEFHEVKGFWRDDARVKFKVAAELFPMFRFVAVRRKHRQWDLSYPRA